MRKASVFGATALTVIILPHSVSLNTINGDFTFTLIFCRVSIIHLKETYSFDTGYKHSFLY